MLLSYAEFISANPKYASQGQTKIEHLSLRAENDFVGDCKAWGFDTTKREIKRKNAIELLILHWIEVDRLQTAKTVGDAAQSAKGKSPGGAINADDFNLTVFGQQFLSMQQRTSPIPFAT